MQDEQDEETGSASRHRHVAPEQQRMFEVQNQNENANEIQNENEGQYDEVISHVERLGEPLLGLVQSKDKHA